MKQYLDLLREVAETGNVKSDRTGTGTRSLFGKQLRFDLREGFPILTTKRVHFKSVVVELLWMLTGDTNIAWLHKHGVTIWDEWATPDGDLGPIYGVQWRSWPVYGDCVVDQIKAVLWQLSHNPDSRRHVVAAWNPAYLPHAHLSPQENVTAGLMALAPCHCLFQFYVADGALSCHMYQRSADLFLGVPFNIASYALLTHLVARCCGLRVHELIMSFGDVHLYNNHLTEDIAYEQLRRTPGVLPTLQVEAVMECNEDLFLVQPADVKLNGYSPQSAITAPVSV